MKTIPLKEAYLQARNKGYHYDQSMRKTIEKHAFNVLPEVVEALEDAVAYLDGISSKDAALEREVCNHKSTLAKANTVQIL